MREIKFRAWDVERKVMYAHAFPVLNRMIEARLNCGTVCRLSLDGPERRGVLMQFTGCVDKNGTDIYEGDILQNEPGFRCAVEWSVRRVGFRDLAFPKLLVVVGNIYENPDLLK